MTLRSRRNRQREALDCGRVSFIPCGGKDSRAYSMKVMRVVDAIIY